MSKRVKKVAVLNSADLQQAAFDWMGIEATSDTEKAKLVSDGKALLNTIYNEHVIFEKKTGIELVKQAILIGQICNKLKEQVKKPGQTWEIWATENIAFIHKRNRMKYMKIASFPEAEQYAFLGVDKLDTLCTFIENLSGDPIATLLDNHKITKCSIGDNDGFRKCIDLCISYERLDRAEIEYDSDQVELLVDNDYKFTKAVITDLKALKDAGEDTKQYIKKMAFNKGPLSAEKENIHINLHDFNSLGQRMISVIDVMLKKVDTTTTIDPKTLNDVEAKIAELKALAGIA